MKLNLHKPSILLIAFISSLFVLEGKAIAQAAEVPNPDINGDFRTAFQQGNRGYYKIEKWLVVQPVISGDYDLNCRYTPNGQMRLRIALIFVCLILSVEWISKLSISISL